MILNLGELNLLISERTPIIKIKKLNILIIYSWLSKKNKELMKTIMPPHNITLFEEFFDVSCLCLDELIWSNKKFFLLKIKYKKNDKNVVVTMAPSYNLEYLGKQYLPNKIFPLAGISKQKTINCNENG